MCASAIQALHVCGCLDNPVRPSHCFFIQSSGEAHTVPVDVGGPVHTCMEPAPVADLSSMRRW